MTAAMLVLEPIFEADRFRVDLGGARASKADVVYVVFSPRGRRRRRPGDHGIAAPPPLRLLAGHFARRGRRRFPVEDRLRRSAPAPASLPSCRPDPARSRCPAA